MSAPTRGTQSRMHAIEALVQSDMHRGARERGGNALEGMRQRGRPSAPRAATLHGRTLGKIERVVTKSGVHRSLSPMQGEMVCMRGEPMHVCRVAMQSSTHALPGGFCSMHA